MSWSTGFCGHRCVIQEMYHRVSIEIPFSYYLPHLNQQQQQQPVGRGRRGTNNSRNQSESQQHSQQQQQPAVSVIQQLFQYLEELIKHYFLHLTLIITADDLANHSLGDIMTFYHRIQLFLLQTKHQLQEEEKMALGYFISLQIPLYPTVTFLQSTMDSVGDGSASLGGEDSQSVASGVSPSKQPKRIQDSSIASTALNQQGDDDNTLARNNDLQQPSHAQSQGDQSMLDSSNFTEKLLEIAFTSFNPPKRLMAKQQQQQKQQEASIQGYKFPPPNRNTPILPHIDTPIEVIDYDTFIPPIVHCIIFDLLPENFQFPYPARIMTLQQHIATMTKTLAPVTEISYHRTMSSHVNNMSTYATVGGLRTFSTLESPLMVMNQSSVLGGGGGPTGVDASVSLAISENSHIFQTDAKNVARNVIQIGTASCQAGDNRGIAYGFTAFTSHDHIDNFIQRNHGKFRIDFIHLNVTELPNIRVNTIEVCHRSGINVLISVDDEVFDAVINAEEVEEEEEGDEQSEGKDDHTGSVGRGSRSGVSESKGSGQNGEEEEDGEGDYGENTRERDSYDIEDDDEQEGLSSEQPQLGRKTLLTELDHEMSVPTVDTKGFKPEVSFAEDDFIEKYEEIVNKYQVSLQTLMVKCLHQLGCIVRLKGVLTNELLAIPEDRRDAVAADSMLRSHYMIQHYGRIVHPFIDRKLFVSEFRVISLEISQDDMETLCELSTYEEEAIDRERAARYIKFPEPKKLDFAYLGWKGGDESMLSIGVPAVVTFGNQLDNEY